MEKWLKHSSACACADDTSTSVDEKDINTVIENCNKMQI
jgi:hypothetical protein